MSSRLYASVGCRAPIVLSLDKDKMCKWRDLFGGSDDEYDEPDFLTGATKGSGVTQPGNGNMTFLNGRNCASANMRKDSLK